jgi:hypothetical protein
VGVVVVAIATDVVATGEEEVVVICSMLCAKGGRMAVVLMGHPKNASTVVACLGILLGNVGPKRRWAKPTWPRWTNPHYCYWSPGKFFNLLLQQVARIQIR